MQGVVVYSLNLSQIVIGLSDRDSGKCQSDFELKND